VVKGITDKQLAQLKQSAERMLGMRSPAVDDEWWQNLLSAVTELQEFRKCASDPTSNTAQELAEINLKQQPGERA